MVIVGEFVGGAALGAAFGLLFDAVKKAADKPSTFKPLFENIKFSLKFLKPMIQKIGEHNVELGLPDEEIKYITREMEEGVKLVQKSSKVSKWNCMKFYYTDQLIELDGSLKRLLDILMVQGIRDGKETLILARKHQEKLTESARVAKETLVLAQKNNDQLTASTKDGKQTLVLANQNLDQLIKSSRDGKETLDLARQNNDKLNQSARDAEETLVLAKNIKRFLKRIECLVRCYKANSRCNSGSRVSKASTSAGRGRNLKISNLKVYRFTELKDATQNFRPGEFGCGGYGSMYKGWVDEKTLAPSKVGTGIAVAVKRYFSESNESIKQWQLELNLLGRVSHHPNLVKLLGYCCDEKGMFFVHEFIPNESLHRHLYKSKLLKRPLSWENRLKIIIGAARGLIFLHCMQIIHRNVNPLNILLDENYNTKLTNLAMEMTLASDDGESEYVTTSIVGTLGYIDPEYITTGRASLKSDVYSFGVVLLQILTGLNSYDWRGEQCGLANWARPLLCDETKLETIMDEQLKGQYSSEEALLTAQLALRCLEIDPQNRPSMEKVGEELEYIWELGN